MTKNGPEKKDKTASIVRNVVYGIALFAAAVSIVSLFANYIELMLFTPNNTSNEVWMDYHFTVAALFILSAILTAIGVAFAVVSIKVKKLRFASMFVFVGIALILMIFAIAATSGALDYVTDGMTKWETPVHTNSAAVTYSSGFAAAALEPGVCFVIMAVCSLFMFLEDRKEKQAIGAAQSVTVSEEVPAQSAPAQPETADNATDETPAKHKFCTNCGAKANDDSKFCIHCGAKLE